MFNFIKKLFKFFALIFLGILIALVILECVLQVTSIIINNINSFDIKKEVNKSKNHISIMCIGESTTHKQYTKYLKYYLHKYYPEKVFYVFDCGHPACRLNELYYHYKKQIKQYKPNIIVGMIGINDMIDTNFKTYSKIKTIYLYNLIRAHIKSLNYFSKIKKQRQDFSSACDVKNKLSDILFSNNRNQELTNIFADKQKDLLLGIYSMKDEFFSKFITEYYDSNKKDSTFDDVLQDMFNENDDIKKEFKYGFLGIYNLLNDNYILGEQYLCMADEERLNYDYSEISKKYEKILDLIIPNGIKYIAMQYPVRNISSLQKIIDGTKYKDNVIFLSNEQSFRDALKSEHKNDIFGDLFAWDFGHCVKYGNELIANNVAKKITELLKN